MAYNLNYDEILKGEREKVNAQKAERDATINTLYDSQKKVTTDEYNRDIADTEKSYADAYQKNAVQKLINERQIAESMENLGLTDSGLNRTQQTAAQLSYANQKGKLDISKQQTLDQKSGALAAAIATIEQNRATALADNADYWSGVADSNAQAIYKTNYDAYTAEQKAIIEANTKLQEAAIKAAAENTKKIYTFSGYDAAKGKNAYYSDGKTYYYDVGQNPYTGANNTVYGSGGKTFDSVKNKSGTDTQKAAAVYGVYKNGYQPKGVVVGNTDYGKITMAVDELPADVSPTGKKQNVWQTTDKNGNQHYWLWFGNDNTYIEVYEAKDANGQDVWVTK